MITPKELRENVSKYHERSRKKLLKWLSEDIEKGMTLSANAGGNQFRYTFNSQDEEFFDEMVNSLTMMGYKILDKVEPTSEFPYVEGMIDISWEEE